MAKKIKIDTELVFTSPNIKPVIASIKKQLSGITGTVDIKFKPNITNNFQRVNNELRLLRKNLESVEHQANNTAIALQKVAQVSIRVGSGLSRQNQAVANYNKTLINTKTVSKGASDAIEDFGKKSALAIKRYAAFTVATTGIIGFSVAAKHAFSDAVQFEREFIKIAQVTGKSVGQLRDLSGEIDRLSTGLGVSSKGIVNTAQVLAQAGLTAKDTKIALEALAKTELSPTFGRIEDTTEGAIAAMQQFGIQAKDLDKTLSSLNAVAGAFAVESEDIISVIQKAGGAFKATGGSLNELVALFNSVRQTTRESADQIATGLRTIFTRLERRQTIDFLKTLGVNLTDAQGNFIGVYKSIGLLSDALSKIGQNDPRLTQIFEELGGYRQISRVVPLIQQFTVAERALGIAQRGQNTLSNDAAIAQQTLAVQITKVQEEFKSLFRIIANDSSIRQIITLTLELAKSLNQVAKSLAPILPLITAIGVVKGASIGTRFLGGAFGIKRASGGPIPGSGSGDTVPAMLTPGEFVINKKAASNIGASNLNKLNNSAQHFANGGMVEKPGLGGAIGAGLLLSPLITNQLGEFGQEISKVTNILGLLAIGATALGVKFSSVSKVFESPTDISKRLQGRGLNEEAFANIQKSSKYIQPFSNQQKSGLRNIVTQQLYQGLPPGLQPHPQRVEDETNKQLRQLTVARRQINNDLFKQERNRLLNEKTRSINLEHAQKIGGFTGIGMGIAGGVFSNIGAERISKGDKSGVGYAGFGGALTGAGVGGGIGAAFGPLGFAIGGAIGGLAGLYQASKDAADQLERIKTQESFDKFSDALNRVITGKSTTSSQAGIIVSSINKLQNELKVAPTGESRDLIISNLKGATAQLENFVLKLTSESKTFEEFQNSNAGLGKRSLSALSLSANIPLKDLETEVKKNIEINKKGEEVQTRLNKATFNTANEIEKFIRFTQSVNDASLATDKLINEFNILDDVLGGGLTGGKFLGTGNGREGILQATGNKDLADTASQLENVIKTLPDILVDLRGDNPLEEKVLTNFADKLKDIPAFIRDQILAQAESIGGGEAGFLKEIDRNVFDLAQKLTDGFNPILDSIKTISDNFKNRVEELNGQFNKLSENELRLVEGRIKSEEIAFSKVEFLAGIQNRNVTPEEAGRFDQTKQGIMLGETVLGVGSTATEIADEIIALREQISKQNEVVQNAPRDKIFQETRFFHNLIKESNLLSKALGDMVNPTKKLTALQNQLAQEQQKRQLKQDIAKQFVFGSQEEQLQLNKDIKAAQIAAQFGTVKGFSAENKAGALRIFEQFGDIKSEALGGLSGNENIRRIAANDISGGNIDLELLKALQGTSTAEDRLITEITSLIESQKNAQDELNRVLESGNTDLSNKLEIVFDKFIADQERLFRENTAAGLKRLETSTKGKLTEAQNQQKALANLEPFGGISGAKSIKNILPLIEEGKKLRSTQQSLESGLLGFRSKFNPRGGAIRLSDQTRTELKTKAFDEFSQRFSEQFSPVELEQVKGKFNKLDPWSGREDLLREQIRGIAQQEVEAKQTTVQESLTETTNNAANMAGSFKRLTELINLSSDSIKTLNDNLSVLADVESPEKLASTIQSLETELESLKTQLQNVQAKAGGGRIFSPRGTDTVPAMLTPGEFVVNRKAAQANIGLLQDINSNSGNYFANGGSVPMTVRERREKIVAARQARVAERFKAQGIESPISTTEFRGSVEERREFQLLQLKKRSIQRAAKREAHRDMLIEAGIDPDQHKLPFNAKIRERQNRADFLKHPTAGLGVRQDREDFLKNPRTSIGHQSRADLIERARANRRAASAGGARSGYANGGIVGYANGGSVTGGASDNGFNESVNKFMNASSQLVEAMNKFPHTITMETTGRIEVIHNGAEVFQQMQPAMANYVDGKIKDAINKLMKGPLQGAAPR